MPDAVVYEVNLDVEPDIIEEFDSWLETHVDEMLEIAGFESAEIFCGPERDDGRATRTVIYKVRSKEELQSYFHTHATRMRKIGRERFGDNFSANRRIVPARGYQLPAKLQPLAVTHEHAHPRCANCQTPLLGRYCHACGQEDRTYFLSLWYLVGEFFQEILDHDSKLYRSLLPLLFRPGFLTKQYVLGRRVHYVRPVRLYLFVSIVFFFFTAIMTDSAVNNQAILDVNGGDQAEETTIRLGDEDRGILPSWVELELEEKLKRIKSEPRRFVNELMSNVPLVMFLLLPVFALIMKILYLFSRRYYVEHLVFAIHYHSFVFLALLINFYLVKVSVHYPIMVGVADFTAVALSIYLPLYLWLAMRFVYKQGRIFTTFKYFLLVTAYLAAMVPAIIGVVLLSAWTY